MHDNPVRAFWITGPLRGELRETALARRQPDQVRIQTLYSAISRGTETLVWRGAVPVTEHERMRAPFQEGDFPWPLKYGYITVGSIVSGPPELLGQTIFCLHPHQERFVVPAEAVSVLPEGLPPERAVLAANMETAVNALWDAAPLIGERITVIGAGVVGLLVAHLASKIPGTRVQIVDPLEAKVSAAKALGLECVLPADAKADADLILHASGSPSGLQTALELAGFEARIVELSWYGDTSVELALGGAFHSKRLKLISSQVGHLPSAQMARWNFAKRMKLALALLRDPVYDALISGEDEFENLPNIMSNITEDRTILCHRIRYTKR
jgi:2-desacetyl-2-hydroxyethyl bacteriochlorophyllide A dehydrogenase